MDIGQQATIHNVEEPQTLQQRIAAVHCQLIIDKLNSMNLSKEKRKEIMDRVIKALRIKAQQPQFAQTASQKTVSTSLYDSSPSF